MKEKPLSLDRRTLLQAAGAAAALAATPRALRAQSKEQAATKVIVIGAGLSGLNAALTLEQAGISVTVIEGRDRVGGRVFSHRNVPGNPESGGTSFGPGYARLVDAANRYKVGLIDLTPIIPFFFKRELALDGQLIPAAAWPAHPRNPFPAGAREVMPWAFLPGFLGKNNPLKATDEWLAPDSAQYDVALHQWLRSKGLSDEIIDLTYDLAPSHGNTAWDVSALMVLFAAMFTQMQQRLAGKVAGYTAVGGNLSIPEAMAKALKGPVHFRRDVTSLRTDDRGAEVHCADGTKYAADYVICSVPFAVLRRVRIDPLIQGPQAQAIQTLQSQAVTQFHVVAKKPFWEADGLSPSMYTDGLPGTVIAEHKGSRPEDVTSLTVWTRGHAATWIDQLEPKDAEAAVVKSIEKLRPAARGLLEVRARKSWLHDPFSAGDWAVWQPGQVTAFAKDVAKPHGRIHFCGEHTSVSNRGMEGAMESGERAALEVASRA